MPPRPAPTVRAAFLTVAAALLLLPALTALPAFAQDRPQQADCAEQLREQRDAEMRVRMNERRQAMQAEIRRDAAPPAAAVNEQDSLALVALYNSTDGDNWDDNSGWLSAPVADWYGVTVSGDRVVEVEVNPNAPFGGNGLDG